MIKLDNITKKFDDQIAVKNLSLEIKKGYIVALVGSSGCGKSTTLRMINRLIEPTSGNISIDGKNINDLDAVKLRRKIGYAIQNHGLFPHWTVEQNIATVPHLLGWDKKKIKKRIQELMDMFRLDYKLYYNKRPSQLSGGQQQRVGVARALAANPNILLMDEPFGALDPITRAEIQEEFLQIQSDIQKTIIMVTHDIDEALKMADKVAIMDKGKLLQYDDPQSLLLDPRNQFVADMIGSSERGLKLLTHLTVKDRMRKPEMRLSLNYSHDEVYKQAKEKQKRIWLVDKDKRPLGYCSPDPRLPNFVSVSSSAWLCSKTSLTEALSQMIWYEGKAMAVVNDKGELIGDISFRSFPPHEGHLTGVDV